MFALIFLSTYYLEIFCKASNVRNGTGVGHEDVGREVVFVGVGGKVKLGFLVKFTGRGAPRTEGRGGISPEGRGKVK